ncbi:MAG: tetratricopeptide repeat protein [Bdellovibrionales bacterium]
MKILNPIVRPSNGLNMEPATPHEKIEYAETLRKLGTTGEAAEILSSLNPTDYPHADFVQAMCHFSKWHYGEAIPCLERYVDAPTVPPYQKLVGRLNLAAAFVHEKNFSKAEPLITALRQETEEQSHWLLHGHTLELSAQLEIERGQWDSALQCLSLAEACLSRTGSVGLLWIRKWRAICHCLQAGEVRAELYEVLEEAKKTDQWETHRDCCYYAAKIKRDVNGMNFVYFGTPYGSYRQNIVQSNHEWYQPPEVFHWGQANSDQVFDVSTGCKSDGTQIVPRGQLAHRLAALLTRDFFRPTPVVEAFGALFPGEYFNPTTSPNRVHQAVVKLKKCLIADGIDLAIQKREGRYFWRPENIAIRVKTQTPNPGSGHSIQLDWLIGQFSGHDFTVSEAAQSLGVSASTGLRLLRWGLSHKRLRRIGSGPATRYRSAA